MSAPSETRRRFKRSSSKKGADGYRHKKSCAHAGSSLAEVSLNASLCICDPHGTKKRAVEIAMEKFARRNVLSQDEVWYPKEGAPVRLDEMSLRWKKNLLAFLERRADRLQFSAHLNLVLGPQPSGEAAIDGFDSMLAEEFELKPTTWLYRQPLVLRLEQLIREGHDGPEDRNNQCIREGCTRPKADGVQDCAEHIAEVIYG